MSGAAAAITADSLRSIFWKLKSQFRANATWVMSSDTASQLDRLKSGDGTFMWRDGMTEGAPPTLLGRPVEIDENFPAVEAGALPIAFGDFSQAYTIVDRLGLRSLRDPFTDKPNVLFYQYKRVGGGLSNSEAVKVLKVAAS